MRFPRCVSNSNDSPGARHAILHAEERSRRGDEFSCCQQVAITGRLLLEVEFDVARARDFLREAERMAAVLMHSFVELDWGRGLIARWDGDLVTAQAAIRRALALARLREDRWREMKCLVWMAKIAIDGELFDEACAVCDEIDAVAARIGDGPAPVADALRATAQTLKGAGERQPELQRTLAALWALDDKAQLAYVLNQIAAYRLERGYRQGAFAAATEALGAADAVKRATEIDVARSLLARRAAAGVDESEAAPSSPARPECFDGDASTSARARAWSDRSGAAHAIPTPVPTASS